MVSLALRKLLEERRRSLPQRELAASQNILLQRRIRAAARQAIVKSQQLRIESQLSAMGMHDQKITELRRTQIMESLGLT